jgi:hypothetical protein
MHLTQTRPLRPGPIGKTEGKVSSTAGRKPATSPGGVCVAPALSRLRSHYSEAVWCCDALPGASPTASSGPAQLNGPLEPPASVGHQTPLGRHDNDAS